MDNTLVLQEIEEMANIGTFEADTTSNTWKASDNFLKIFGLLPKSSYTLEDYQALIHPEDVERIMNLYFENVKNGHEFRCDYRAIRPDGKLIYVHSRSKVIRDANQQPVKVIGIKHDVTEHMQQTHQLEQMNELNMQKSEVLANVAHDLKSPLNSLEGMISVLRSDIPEGNSKLLDMMENACAYASELVHDLVEMSEMENITQSVTKTPQDVNQLLAMAIQRLEEMCDKKKIKVVKHFSENAIAPIHSVKMIRAFTNLLSNAIKFSHTGSSIIISTKKLENVLLIKIQDHGIGIHEEEVKQLFVKFSKLSKKGTHGEKSTGLGLYIVKQIVDLHDGHIQVESRPEQGSTFQISLPLS